MFIEDLTTLKSDVFVSSPIMDSWSFLLNHLEKKKAKVERIAFGSTVCHFWQRSGVDDFIDAVEQWFVLNTLSVSAQDLEEVKLV